MPKQFSFEKLKKSKDVYLPKDAGFGPDDVAILVMGSSGAGKSTFINNALDAFSSPNGARATISDGFESCSSELCHYILNLPKEANSFGYKRAVLLDTPGFDNSGQTDEEILRRIAVWITSCYLAGVHIGGVVYIHPIFPARMGMSHGTSLNIFRRICGSKALSMTVFATSRWDLCSESSGRAREEELKKTFWSDMFQSGRGQAAQIERLDNSPQSAKQVLDAVLRAVPRMDKDVVLTLQQQLVERNTSLHKTDAGRLVMSNHSALSRVLNRIMDLLGFSF